MDPAGIGQVWVPAGSFTMGTDAATISALTVAAPPSWVATEFPSEVPAHTVQLTHGYWIDTDEVTNEAFAAFKARRRLHDPGALVRRRLDLAQPSGRRQPAARLRR